MSNPTTITAPEGVLWIEIERRVGAPLDAVWRAYSDPDLLSRWLGPHGMEMEVTGYDLRTGGAWAFIHRDERGEYRFHGSFHDVRPGESITQTFEFEGAPGHPSLERVALSADGDGTLISIRSVHLTQEARDAHLAAGMEHGVREGFERLDALLA